MATEEDNFDIDIYGDGSGEFQITDRNGNNPHRETNPNIENNPSIEHNPNENNSNIENNLTGGANNQGRSVNMDILADQIVIEDSEDRDVPATNEHQIAIDDIQLEEDLEHPEDPANIRPIIGPVQQIQQISKRRDGPDMRPIDPGATTAIFLADLHWWTTDDDIRGWINQAGCEDELRDITFSEHKVNGKSKGQAFVEFTSPQAATAAKRVMDSIAQDQQANAKKFSMTFTNPYTNPFRTLPKDAPSRTRDGQSHRPSPNNYNNGSMGGSSQQGMGYSNTGAYRGGRGYRGSSMSRYSSQTFSTPMSGGGYQPMGGYQSPQMTPIQQPYGGYQNRGGMIGIRGSPSGMRSSRGGMPNAMMTGMPMGGMPINAMANQMGSMSMGQMSSGMAMQPQGFGAPHFNGGYYPQGSTNGTSEGSWNPHGSKRTRQE